jgi:hypothetical protein
MGDLVDCDTEQPGDLVGRFSAERDLWAGCVCRRFEQLAGPGTQACVTGQLSDCATVRRRLCALGDSGLSEFEI